MQSAVALGPNGERGSIGLTVTIIHECVHAENFKTSTTRQGARDHEMLESSDSRTGLDNLNRAILEAFHTRAVEREKRAEADRGLQKLRDLRRILE